MRPIRLAYPLGRLARGGAELQMIALAERLTKQGFRVDFVTRAGSGPLDVEARAAGATIRQIGELSTPETPRHIVYARRVARNARWVLLARRSRYDIVDAWLQPADAVAALTRPVTRTPVVMSARLGKTPEIRLGPATGLYRSMLHRLTDVVVANAEITAADAIADGVPARRVRIIRGGVALPPTFTTVERQAQRAALGASEGSVIIGNVGNFRWMKRHDLLIDAFARLLPQYAQIRLVLVGDGDLRPQIEQQIDRLGLGRRVVLLGTAHDLPPLYDAFDLFVQASSSEGLPNVLLEASASGLPIVATAAGGSGEVIHDGETGLLVPVDDIDRLVAAMDRAIGEADLRNRIGLAARRLIERDYGMDRFVKEYADLYRELLAEKSPERTRG